MKVTRTNTLNERGDIASNVRSIESDLNKLFQLAQGRIRFGDATDNIRGENIEGRFQQFTSDASANTEFSVAHGLGAVPLGRIIFWQNKAGSLYQGPSTGTAWDATNAYFKCDQTSVTFLVFFIK